MLKACPSKSQTPETPCESEVANNLIYELLNALIAKPVEVPEEGNIFCFSIFIKIHSVYHFIERRKNIKA